MLQRSPSRTHSLEFTNARRTAHVHNFEDKVNEELLAFHQGRITVKGELLLQIYTIIHTAISLVAILTGFVVFSTTLGQTV